MPIEIHVRAGGTFEVVATGNLEVADDDFADIEATVDVLAPKLSPGVHQLLEVADAIDRARPDSIPAQTFSDMLRQIERQYRAPCQGDIPLFVSDPEHTTGTVYVCGDIHGQYDALQAELARVGFDRQRDLLYCTGDLVDRGADSFKCLSLAFEPWSRFILGNHERLAWDALKDGPGPGNAWDHWQANGGSWVYLEGALEVKSILGEALRHLPLAREITIGDRRIGFCHAEPPANWQWVRDNPEAYIDRLTWGRTRHTRGDTTPVEGIDAVVVGHTIVDTPTWYGNVHFLDTGAFTPYGHLTLIPLQEVVDALTKPAGGSA